MSKSIRGASRRSPLLTQKIIPPSTIPHRFRHGNTERTAMVVCFVVGGGGREGEGIYPPTTLSISNEAIVRHRFP